MARKDKTTVDYFPHQCESGKTLFILEKQFGNDGYAVWFKTLEHLGRTSNHFLDVRQEDQWQYLIAHMNVDEETALKIYDLLAKLDAINQELWQKKIIYSHNFVQNLKPLYERRNNSCMQFDDLCDHLHIKCLHTYSENGFLVIRKPQSKGKERKEKKRKEIDFDVFWNEYDNKIGSKATAQKYWDGQKKLEDDSLITPEDQENILQVIPSFKKYYTLKRWAFPMATTFLHQRRWEGEFNTKAVAELAKPTQKEVAEIIHQDNSPEAVKERMQIRKKYEKMKNSNLV